MNLRDQLKEILPDILPRNPAQAIKGTELIEMVKHRLKQDYSDATLRYHFSIMSCDPSSPIAKVEQGQGYYLRSTTIHTLNSARNMIGSQLSQSSGNEQPLSGQEVDVVMARANKFRAVVQRYMESVQQHSFSFEQSFSIDAAANRWRVPDLAVVQWIMADGDEEETTINRDELDVFRRLGRSPFRISSIKLRLQLEPGDLYQNLYQTLATSEWANTGELMVAENIEDPAILEEIRSFSSRYGVGVVSFGLDADILDDMPEPAAIENLGPDEFGSIQSLFQMRRYAAPNSSTDFSWEHVSLFAHHNQDFADFRNWISKCLVEERMISSREYLDSLRDTAAETTGTEYVA